MTGVCEDSDEDVESKVMEVAAAIGANLSLDEMDRTHRLENHITNQSSQCQSLLNLLAIAPAKNPKK
ncbi:hypothetical protein ACF0H5_012234 [Mactra antiquata]